jgi:hypothetical protein
MVAFFFSPHIHLIKCCFSLHYNFVHVIMYFCYWLGLFDCSHCLSTSNICCENISLLNQLFLVLFSFSFSLVKLDVFNDAFIVLVLPSREPNGNLPVQERVQIFSQFHFTGIGMQIMFQRSLIAADVFKFLFNTFLFKDKFHHEVLNLVIVFDDGIAPVIGANFVLHVDDRLATLWATEIHSQLVECNQNTFDPFCQVFLMRNLLFLRCLNKSCCCNGTQLILTINDIGIHLNVEALVCVSNIH